MSQNQVLPSPGQASPNCNSVDFATKPWPYLENSLWVGLGQSSFNKKASYLPKAKLESDW